MSDPTKPKIENLQLNRETIQDLEEETLADLVADQAEGARGGVMHGEFLLAKDSKRTTCKCPY
jgi:hypothetical protein